MTKMAAMPLYGKSPSKFSFSDTNKLISKKLGVKDRWLKYSYVYINHDPVMTLTKFMARSTWVAYAFEWEKLLKCHLKGKASGKFANGQNIDYSEKRKWPKGFICPCTGVKYHNIQKCSRSQVSVYRTIGPLVSISETDNLKISIHVCTILHFFFLFWVSHAWTLIPFLTTLPLRYVTLCMLSCLCN